MDELTHEQLKVILDVINVYDPEEIKKVYPEMASHEFLGEVRETFQKVLHLVSGLKAYRAGWIQMIPELDCCCSG